MATAVSEFDLGTLTATELQAVEYCTREVKEFIRKTGRDAHRIGLLLKSVKQMLGHGRFLVWLQAEFGWSADTAERLMKVAERFTEIPQPAEFSLTALYLLAGDHVPEEARREAIDRATAGEAITPPVARAIAARHKAAGGGSAKAVKGTVRTGQVPPGGPKRAREGDPPAGSDNPTRHLIIVGEPRSDAPVYESPRKVVIVQQPAEAAEVGAESFHRPGVRVVTGRMQGSPGTTLGGNGGTYPTEPIGTDLCLLLQALTPLAEVDGEEAEADRVVEQLARGWSSVRAAALIEQAGALVGLLRAAVTALDRHSGPV